MKNLKKLLQDKTGAASILVILLMVVFSVLGLLAMIYAHNNYLLSEKTLAWHDEYYELDGVGETLLSQMALELNNIGLDSASYPEHIAKVEEYYANFSLTLPQNAESELIPYSNGYDGQNAIGINLSGENHTLYIEVLPLYGNSQGSQYKITAWNLKAPDYDYEYNPYQDWAIIE